MLEGYFPTAVEWGLFVSCAVFTSVVTLFDSFIPSRFLRDFLVLVLKYEKIPLVECPIIFFNVYNEMQHNIFASLPSVNTETFFTIFPSNTGKA